MKFGTLSYGVQQFGKMTIQAQYLWKQFLRRGDSVIDATCGNGADSLYIARLLGPNGTLLSFDIQEQAIHSTKFLLGDQMDYQFHQRDDICAIGCSKQGPEIKIFKQSHERIGEYKEEVPGEVKLVTFNLGYLPGGDKEITTQTQSTLRAVKSALETIGQSGMVTIIAYIGHPEGIEEYQSLNEFLTKLDSSKWLVSEYRIKNRTNSPILLTILRAR
eukprot:g7289.t1